MSMNNLSIKHVSLLFLFYVVLFSTVLSYNSSWMLPETMGIKAFISLKNDPFSISNFLKIFDFMKFEFSPRTTRPLSSLLEVIDAHFRSLLWNFFPPHPAVSLTWIFSLFLSPLFLFKIARKIDGSKFFPIATVLLFISSTALLSTASMYFRPAKSMANFSLILMIYFFTNISNFKNNKKIYIITFLIFTLSHFWDESFLVIYPILFILHPEILKFKNNNVLLYMGLSFTFFVCSTTFIFPLIAKSLGHEIVRLSDYDPLKKLAIFDIVYFKELIKNTAINIKIIFFESLGLAKISYVKNNFLKIIFGLNYVISFAIIANSFYKRKQSIEFKKIYIIFFTLCLIHSLLLSTVDNKIWGPYWYGTFVSIFSSLIIAKFISNFKDLRLQIISLLSIVSCTLIQFHYTNWSYRKFHFYPYDPLKIALIFQNKINRFETPIYQERSVLELSKHYREYFRKNGNLQLCIIPKDLLFIPIEYKITNITYEIGLVRDSQLSSYTIIPPEGENQNPFNEPSTLDPYLKNIDICKT